MKSSLSKSRLNKTTDKKKTKKSKSVKKSAKKGTKKAKKPKSVAKDVDKYFKNSEGLGQLIKESTLTKKNNLTKIQEQENVNPEFDLKLRGDDTRSRFYAEDRGLQDKYLEALQLQNQIQKECLKLKDEVSLYKTELKLKTDQNELLKKENQSLRIQNESLRKNLEINETNLKIAQTEKINNELRRSINLKENNQIL